MTPELPRAPIKRTVGDGLADLGHLGVVGQGAQFGGDRLDGERHIGPGVAVGHRVDVQAIDDVLMGTQQIRVGGDRRTQFARRTASTERSSLANATMVIRFNPAAPAGARDLRRMFIMASVCEICGKKPSFGMNVSHSHRRTKRRWNPNIQRVRARGRRHAQAHERLHRLHPLGQGHQARSPPRRAPRLRAGAASPGVRTPRPVTSSLRRSATTVPIVSGARSPRSKKTSRSRAASSVAISNS